MPKTKAKTLDEFAAIMGKPGKKAWLTELPELDKIVTAYRNGIGPRVIYEWLKQEQGYGDDVLRGYNTFRSALRDQAARP